MNYILTWRIITPDLLAVVERRTWGENPYVRFDISWHHTCHSNFLVVEKTLILTIKALTDTISKKSHEVIVHIVLGCYKIRFADSSNCISPVPKKMCWGSTFSSVLVLRLWRILPTWIKDASSQQSSKQMVKDYFPRLFTFCLLFLYYNFFFKFWWFFTLYHYEKVVFCYHYYYY